MRKNFLTIAEIAFLLIGATNVYADAPGIVEVANLGDRTIVDCRAYSEGLAAIKDSTYGWGYIDEDGKIVIEPQFQEARDFSKGYACVKRNGNQMFIDKTGNTVSAGWKNYGTEYSEGILQVQDENGKWGYVDTNGEIVLEPQWDSSSEFHDGLAAAEKDGLYGYINTTGKFVIPPQWDYAGAFDDSGLGYIVKNKERGYIDENGNIVISPQFDDCQGSFSEDLQAVSRNGKWGFIDKSGKFVIAPKYESAGNFVQGVAAVKIDGEWKYINKNEETVFESISLASTFSEGYAVFKDEGYGLLDKDGNIILDPKYHMCTAVKNGLTLVQEGGLLHIYDVSNVVVDDNVPNIHKENANESLDSQAEYVENVQQEVVEYKDATTIKIVQQTLNEAGYNCGTPDGLAGSKTVEAITAYQTAKGITVNGLVTDELLQSLGVVEKVQETVKEEANKSKNDEEEVDAIFSKFAGCTGVQVGEQIRNVDGSNVALGYVVKFKKILYSCIVNPNNNGKISIFIAPQDEYKSTLNSNDYVELVTDLVQSFDTSISYKDALTATLMAISKGSYSMNGYDYTFMDSLHGMIITN